MEEICKRDDIERKIKMKPVKLRKNEYRCPNDLCKCSIYVTEDNFVKYSVDTDNGEHSCHFCKQKLDLSDVIYEDE